MPHNYERRTRNPGTIVFLSAYFVPLSMEITLDIIPSLHHQHAICAAHVMRQDSGAKMSQAWTRIHLTLAM